MTANHPCPNCGHQIDLNDLLRINSGFKRVLTFEAFYWFVSYWQFSFGITFDFKLWNMEIHVPTGFFKIGWCERLIPDPASPAPYYLQAIK